MSHGSIKVSIWDSCCLRERRGHHAVIVDGAGRITVGVVHGIGGLRHGTDGAAGRGRSGRGGQDRISGGRGHGRRRKGRKADLFCNK